MELEQNVLPNSYDRRGIDGGLYIQDQWTRDRMTLNLGLRFDYLNEWVPANDLPAGRFVPARSFPKVDNLGNYKDLSPRFGFVYDLTNDGKTALKTTVNRFVVNQLTGIAGRNDPLALTVLVADRDWDDANLDFLPDCDLANVEANGECGQLSNTAFGQANPTELGYNPDLLTGWGVRNYNWEVSAQLQRELMTGVSAEVGYFRRWYGGFVVRDNLLVEPSDYNEFCADAPEHPRLPGGGGYEVCGYYDLPRELASERQRQWNSTDNYSGDTSENWHGVDANVNVRMAGATLSGGMSTGRLRTVNCAVVDFPIGTVQRSTATEGDFCDTSFPWLTQVKFQGSYMLPYDIQLSGGGCTGTCPEPRAAAEPGRMGTSGPAGPTSGLSIVRTVGSSARRRPWTRSRMGRSFSSGSSKWMCASGRFSTLGEIESERPRIYSICSTRTARSAPTIGSVRPGRGRPRSSSPVCCS